MYTFVIVLGKDFKYGSGADLQEAIAQLKSAGGSIAVKNLIQTIIFQSELPFKACKADDPERETTAWAQPTYGGSISLRNCEVVASI